MDNQSNKLTKQLELENGGPLEWKTYAFLLAGKDRQILTKGGLLYIVQGTLIFEDFESDRPIYRIISTTRTPYKKTKKTASLDSITLLKEISRRDALKILRGKRTLAQVTTPGRFKRFLDRTVHAVQFNDGTVWFCEMYDTKNLEDYINPRREYESI